MRRFTINFVTILICLGLIEAGYRAFLFLKYPERFEVAAPRDDDFFAVMDKSQWRYSQSYGYEYVAGGSETGIIRGHVTACNPIKDINEHSAFGPPIPDFDSASIRIVVYGDSFTASSIDGKTWTSLLQDDLEDALRQTVRVMNLGRDGYGILQMFDLAAGTVSEIKPNLAIFAFNSSALTRDRSWRTVLGSDDDARVVTTQENTPIPSLKKSTDVTLLMPNATAAWCKRMVSLSFDEQNHDATLQKILAKRARILAENDAQRPVANILDYRSSYVLDQLIRRNAFASQWEQLRPGTNPILHLTDFMADDRFRSDIATLKNSGVPIIVVHLPLGVSLSQNNEFYFDTPQSQPLLASLNKVLAEPICPLRDRLNVAPMEAMKLCRKKDDCHPSALGMKAYADAISQIVIGHLTAETVLPLK